MFTLSSSYNTKNAGSQVQVDPAVCQKLPARVRPLWLILTASLEGPEHHFGDKAVRKDLG